MSCGSTNKNNNFVFRVCQDGDGVLNPTKSGKEVTNIHVPDSRENESPRYDTGAAHL